MNQFTLTMAYGVGIGSDIYATQCILCEKYEFND